MCIVGISSFAMHWFDKQVNKECIPGADANPDPDRQHQQRDVVRCLLACIP